MTPVRAGHHSPPTVSKPMSVRAAVWTFALSGIVIVLLIGLGMLLQLRHAARQQTLEDARRITRLVADTLVEPTLASTDGGGPKRTKALDEMAWRLHRARGSVRIKVWDRTGRIVYSDDHRLIGRRYDLGREEVEVIDDGGSEAEVSDLTRPENRYERHFGKLLEVYTQAHDVDGTPLLFESYQTYRSVDAAARRSVLRFAPAILAAMLLLELLQVPLALSLARRIRDQQLDRERLLRNAVAASAEERRRLAADLHDGVVQHFSGISIALHAAAASLREQAPDAARAAAVVDAASADVRAGIRELRTLLVEIYPPALREAGLVAALDDLVAALPSHGITPHLDVDEHLDPPDGVAELVFRVVQESVRNAERHGRASNVWITVATPAPGDGVRVTVRDDGRGFDTGQAAGAGHLGQRLLRDLLDAAGGELRIESEVGAGTTVTAEVPLHVG
jgi:signal transduction histidine kinase